MKLRSGAWVVIADGGHAILFENTGTALKPVLRALRAYDLDNPPSHELGRDRPPRTVQSAGVRRAAHEAPDPHQTNKDRFVEHLVAELEDDAAEGRFRDLAIFAPPAVLGKFRKHVSGALARHVIAWIDKDLTRMPVPEVTKAVARALST